MPLFGSIVVIKRNGTDGISFPLTESSCLFGRRTECDIRIQLPQVSKEHCKIEVNENKEAILTNLSTVNPTKLNGGCFQQPVPLKHGDVLTIIDRSFRFEYPLQSTPRKRHPRSPKDEMLQVLHLQQVAEVESCKQTAGSKNLHVSDTAECKEKNANEIKQTREENLSKALPIKPKTPKSLYRAHQSVKNQSEMSPFSKLYEKLKHEFTVKKTQQGANAPQQAAKEDAKSVLEPGASVSSSGCIQGFISLNKENETGRRENTEEYKITVKQDMNSSELSQSSAEASATKKSFTRSPQTSVSKKVLGSADRSNLKNCEELSTTGRSKGTKVPATPSKESSGNAPFLPEQCSIECLGNAEKMKHSSAMSKPAQTNKANVYEVDILTTPTSRRKGCRSHFISPTRGTSGMNPVTADTPTSRYHLSLKRKSLSEMLSETQLEDSASRNRGHNQQPLAEEKCSRQKSEQHTPGKPVEEVMKGVCDQVDLADSKEGHCETPASLPNIKSSRRSNRRSKELPDKNVSSETLSTEEVTSELSCSAGQKSGSGRNRGRPKSSGLLTEKAPEASAVEEHQNETTGRKSSGTKKDLSTDLEAAGVTRPCRLSSKRRSSESTTVPNNNETISEVNISGLLAGEESGKKKTISQKRKSGDMLLQPLGKRKRVSFGGHLSPELFDKSLPPNSPLKKGAIPARLSLPFGNSPHAVLKKAQGPKHFAVQELQKEKMSPKNASAQKSLAASSPTSGKATPNFTLGSPAPYKKGRFSVSRITPPVPIAEEEDAVAESMNKEEKGGAKKTARKSSHMNQDDKTSLMATPEQLTRSTQPILKVTPMRRRSGAVAVIKAKRRSGASSANLLVAKSWAEVVKSGVARPQSKTVKKSVQKGRSLKKKTQSSKTPERKIKGHFSTGHAESPATIVVGRAYSTTVRRSGRIPKVVINPLWKLGVKMDESFTGMTEMFQTPENKSGKALPFVAVQKTDFTPMCPAEEISELHTPEETGEMMVSPLNSSDASEHKQDSPSICHFLREKQSLKPMFDAMSTKSPERRKAVLEENISVGSSSIIPGEQTSQVKLGRKKRTARQKLEPPEVASGIEQLFRTPKQRSEPVEALSGIKQLMKTPKQKSEPAEVLSGIKLLMQTPEDKLEPVEVLSGIKQLLRTPKQKLEPAEVLSGIRQLLKTPKQKLEPVEVLSGVKQLMRTPKQKLEPVEVLSGIKQLMRTPKQKSEPAEVLSDIRQLLKTPKQKLEPVEVLSGIKHLMRTPKQKSEPAEVLSDIRQLLKTPKQKLEPVEVLSGIKHLMRTPKQKLEPVEVLSGVKHLMRTPKQKLEPVEVLSGIKQLMRTPQWKPQPAEVLSGIKQLMKSPEEELEPATDEIAFERLLKTPVQEGEAANDVAGVNLKKKIPKLKYQPVEDMIGISRIFKSPKEKAQPVENAFGISRLVKTPKEKQQPVDDFVGLQRLMAEPRQKRADFEVDYVGVTEMFEAPEEIQVRPVNVVNFNQEDTAPPNFTHECGGKTPPVLEDKGNISQGEYSQQTDSTSEEQFTQRTRRARTCKIPHAASAKQSEKDLNLKELQKLETKSTKEETSDTSTSPSVAKKKGRGRRPNHCIQEEIVSEHPDQEKVEIVSPHGATQRPGRAKRKGPDVLKQASENLDSCGKDASVIEKEPADTKQTLQECGTNAVLEAGDDPTMKAESVSRSIQNESSQLPTDLKNPENRSNKVSTESKEILLSPVRRTRGGRKVTTEPPVISTRVGTARNEQVKRASSEDSQGTARKLRKGPLAKAVQRDEQAFHRDTEAATAGEPEDGVKLEMKVTETRLKSLRSARRISAEGKKYVCGTALENIKNIQKSEETSTETQSDIKNIIQVSQGDETENAQENTTEAPQRLKAESPSGETNKMPVTALNLEANRTRSRRGKKDSLEEKVDESAKNNTELITPGVSQRSLSGFWGNEIRGRHKAKSETEMDKSSEDSLGCVCVQDTDQVTKEEHSPCAIPACAENRESLGRGLRKRTINKHGILRPKQTEVLQQNQEQANQTTLRRGRGRKVNFQLEEASSKALGGKRSLPEDDKGMTYEDSQHETSENLSSQVKRSRRKQVDSIPQTACSAFMEKQTLIADDGKDEAFAKEQDSAVEATPSSTEDIPLRRGRRREVAAAPQTSRSLSIGRRHGLLEGDDKKMTEREDQNSALGNRTLQAKANASARDKRKKIDLGAEAKSSSSLQGKCGLSETGDKEEATSEEHNVPLGTVSCAKEKPVERGKRKVKALSSHTTNSISLRGKRRLPADSDREEAPKEDQNVLLETSDSSVKERGRRKKNALLLEATSSTSTQGKRGLSKERGRKNSCREANQLILEGSASKESKDLSKQTIPSPAGSYTSLQGLPEDGKNETPEEKENILLEVAPSAKQNRSKVGRKKTTSSKPEETSSTFLREKTDLLRGRSQKKILQEGENACLKNNSPQEKARQLRNKRRNVEFTSEAATSTSLHKNDDLPKNGNTSETQNLRLRSTSSENSSQSEEGKKVNPVQQAASTSRRRKCPTPADGLAPKKLRSESEGSRSLQKGRNRTKAHLGKEDVRTAGPAGGTDRKTRSSTRTRK